MDAKSHRLRVQIQDYLDDIQGSAHKPITSDAIKVLNEATKVMEQAPEEELSPGQRQVAEAAPGYYERVQYKPESEELSPGERAAIEVAHPGSD